MTGSFADTISQMLGRVDASLGDLKGRFPHYRNPDDGRWVTTADGFWTGGFWNGMLWLASTYTGDPHYKDCAARQVAALAFQVRKKTVFKSFLYYYGAAIGAILHQEDLSRIVATEAAVDLLGRYNWRAGLFPLGDEAEESNRVGDNVTSIDSLCATLLMPWAANVLNLPAASELAKSHTLRVLQMCVQEDGSVIQSARFDPQSGEAQQRFTHKGYSDSSVWARAQAWALLGVAAALQYWPNDEQLLEIASRVAAWWIRHIPEDFVAFWDFNDPAIPDIERDTSATAIAATSLLKLAALVSRSREEEQYRSFAKATVESLVDGYLTPVNNADRRPGGMLTQGCFDKRTGLATTHELIWGDYFLFEALGILDGRLDPLAV